MLDSVFHRELKDLINRHSIDNQLNVPDYMLARNIMDHLAHMKWLIDKRDEWFGFKPFEQNKELGVKEGE